MSKWGPGYDFALFKNTPAWSLAKAVEHEDTGEITRLIKTGSVPVDYRDEKFGQTLLTLAIVNGKELSARKLLELGANPNCRAFDDSSPFLKTCQNISRLEKPEEVLLLLIKYGADVNAIQTDTTEDQFGKRKNSTATALGIVCAYGNLAAAKVLVENGASLTKYGDNEEAILSTAVLFNHLDIARYLLIDRKAPIPGYVAIRQPGNQYERKMTITDLLNENNLPTTPARDQIKREILSYLESVGKK